MNKQIENWNRMFNELLEFKEEHGHCLVPNAYLQNPQLGAWVSMQRRQYANFRSGEPSVMTSDRIKLLEKVGFEWVSKETAQGTWGAKFEELKTFKQQFGHCLVPIDWKENPQLGEWVVMQQEAYKMKRNNNVDAISDENITKLNSIGFQWNPISAKQANKLPLNSNSLIGLSQNQASLKAPVSGLNAKLPFLQNASDISPHFQDARQRQAELMHKLARIQAMEDAVRISMNQNVMRAQQGNPQLNFPPYKHIGEPPSSSLYLVGENNHLAPVNFSGRFNDNILTRMDVSPFPTNASISNLPSLKDYNSAKSNACRIVTEESAETLKSNENEPKRKRMFPTDPKEGKKRASFMSSRYPGPQTSDAFWWARFEELKRFREENGHCIVPNRYPPHPPLGNWVSTQRRQYKLWKKGKASSMNNERAKALEDLGFSWVVRNAYTMSIEMKKSEGTSAPEHEGEKVSRNESEKIEDVCEGNEGEKNLSLDNGRTIQEKTMQAEVPVVDLDEDIAIELLPKRFFAPKNACIKRKAVEMSHLDEDYFPHENKVVKACDSFLRDSLQSDAIKVSRTYEHRMLINHFRREEVATTIEDLYEEKDEDLEEDVEELSKDSEKVARFF